MKTIVSLLFITYDLSSSDNAVSRRLLQSQSQPEPTPLPIIGPVGIPCTAPTDDNPPDNCIPPGGQILTDLTTPSSNLGGTPGKIECSENYDCCLCRKMICGSPERPCKEITCNGDQSCIGVQDIQIFGAGDAEINCNGDWSCDRTKITGTGIKQVICSGDYGCARSQFDLECNPNAPCAIQCSGDNSCQGEPRGICERASPPSCTEFIISNTAGLTCADDACSNGIFIFNNNMGGNVLCNGETSCQNTEIVINDIALLICGQINACKNAVVTVTDPRQDFSLECTAPGSCEGLTLKLDIHNHDVNKMKTFRCGAPTACKGAMIEISRSGPQNIFIEKLECNGLNACQNAMFELGAGISFQTCNCGTSTEQACDGVTGIETCKTGLELLECAGIGGCFDRMKIIHNPANYFELICSNQGSCQLFDLTINLNDFGPQPITYLLGYKCTNIDSCKDALITINNQQTAISLSLALIECSGEESCLNTRFVSNGDVQIAQILCSSPTACNGCTNTINNVCQNCDGNGNSNCLLL